MLWSHFALLCGFRQEKSRAPFTNVRPPARQDVSNGITAYRSAVETPKSLRGIGIHGYCCTSWHCGQPEEDGSRGTNHLHSSPHLMGFFTKGCRDV